jgi:hypothetical protein
MSCNIREIKIMLDTNIPKQPIIPLKKSLLYHPLLKEMGELNEYPYFTSSCLYPEELLKSLSYSSQIKFFFNKSNMEYILKKNVTPNNDEQNTSDKNIMTMLRIIFPTKYPYKNNVYSSYLHITKQFDIHFNIMDILPNFLKTFFVKDVADYSYLKINEKVYTVTQTIWLNDIYNHTEYKDLIDKFLKLEDYKSNEEKKIKNELDKKKKIFKLKYEKLTGEKNPITFKVSPNDKSIKNNPTYKRLEATKSNIDNITDPNIDIVNLFGNILSELNSLILSNERNPQYEIRALVADVNIIDKYRRALKNDLNEIEVLEYAQNIFKEKGIILLNSSEDNEKNIGYFKSRYNTYVRFIDNIKNFIPPNRSSTNHEIENIFEDFINNIDEHNLFNKLMNPLNIENRGLFDDITDDDSTKSVLMDRFNKSKNTGVTILLSANNNEPYYEIYLQLNLIGGELNDTNYSIIDCMYKGEYLGENLEYLLNKSLRTIADLNSVRIFFDITLGDAKLLIEEKETEKEKVK